MRRRRSRLAPLPVLLLGSLAFLGARSAAAQDELRVASPGGQVEFRLFVSQPGSGPLPQLAYEIRHRGRTAVKTSFLGLQIHNQEPMLGEKVGLVASNTGEGPGRFRWLKAEYMQNGSLGRLITVEARVWDDAAAFRYLIPRSAPLEEDLDRERIDGVRSGGRLPRFRPLTAGRDSGIRRRVDRGLRSPQSRSFQACHWRAPRTAFSSHVCLVER